MTEIVNLEAVFLTEMPLIDTRAPAEYARGSVPGAVNLPIMNDSEREAIGTCYKQRGSDAAIRLGHQLVSGEKRSERIAQWERFATAHPHGALFCFRGGMRSQIAQEWLLEQGTHYPRIEGGYKRMRSWLSARTEALLTSTPLLLLGGQTGVAKTRVLTEGYNGDPIPGSIDLEGLANHRGSAFGKRVSEQPTQISFELALGVELLKRHQSLAQQFIVEDEGHLIGRCALPQPLLAARKRADWVQLEASLEDRVQHSYENYILSNLHELEAVYGDSEIAFERFAAGLLDAMHRIHKRLGGQRHKAISLQLSDAIASHGKGQPEGHKTWIERLLVDYYDPMYAYQLAKRDTPPIFRGTAPEVVNYLLEQAT